MINPLRVRSCVTLVLLVIGLSGCQTTVQSVNQPLPSAEQLVSTIDQQFGGSADAFLRQNRFANPSGEGRWMNYTAYASKGRADLLEALMSRGWNPNRRVPDSGGESLPLRQAIASNSTQAVYTLLKAGADPDRLAEDCEAGGLGVETYECSSALAQVVRVGTPGMLEPVLEASEQILWREEHYFSGARSGVFTGTKAINFAARRAYELGRGQMFSQAFTQAGFGNAIAEANAAYRAGTRTASQSGGDTGGGGMDDGLAILGLGAALGVGVGAAITGDLDMGAVAETAKALAGSGGSPMGGMMAGSGASGGTSTGATSTAAASGTKSFAIDQQYRPTCPNGRPASRSIPIKTNSAACAQAMRAYARAASCNLYEEQQAAERNYYSACASEIYQ